ncbi:MULTISPECIES: cyclic nucleotide-binding domain-containing protein [unclassified Aureimonas]|uniref:cyclic nucleotide-binding domain-containing protein n=1 Tax=unclassified Aureimonas TaxID=2615206 RepID=UPI0006F78928|nr:MULTISPECIES: cyclic nucleotide-binding domain-containing protein [unclassified Aureimonas]KQT61765.1 cyclic nucleotide-binding protein [Aureimonas sp. Leaf460]KQT65721.1 cyclic nucleotide-binding protein [Aureimonas sp. Leaf427]
MSLESDIAVLAEIPLLSGLSGDQLRLLAFGAEHRRLRAGEILFREGARADAGFVLVQGSVVLVAGRSGHEKEVARVGQGALLGEIALLTDTRRPATATAETDCDVIRITRTLFRRMLEEYPEIAFALHCKFAEDLARMTDDILALENRFGDPA